MWAILNYLQDARDRGEDCKLNHITAHLRSNYKATKRDMKFAIENGWVAYAESKRTYTITRDGREHLAELRYLNKTYFSRYMKAFRERANRR